MHSTVKERWLAKDPVLIEQVDDFLLREVIFAVLICRVCVGSGRQNDSKYG